LTRARRSAHRGRPLVLIIKLFHDRTWRDDAGELEEVQPFPENRRFSGKWWNEQKNLSDRTIFVRIQWAKSISYETDLRKIAKNEAIPAFLCFLGETQEFLFQNIQCRKNICFILCKTNKKCQPKIRIRCQKRDEISV
jgi:hypothetical protein